MPIPEPRLATRDDVGLIGRICAAGFYDDPVLSWAVPDPATRLAKLTSIFTGLATDVVTPGRGFAWIVDDACASLWRDETFDHHAPPPEPGSIDDAPAPAAIPLDDVDLARLLVLDEVMHDHHPSEPHWYLNVISTLPERQGRGLGAAAIEPGLAGADAAGVRTYLESTNPRNRTLYRRAGFADGDELSIPDGPAMLAMWRG